MKFLLLPAHYLKTRLPNGIPNIRFVEDMDHKRVSMAASMGLGGEAMCQVIDARKEKPVPFMFGNRMVMQTPWTHNLITNQGMNWIGENGIVIGNDGANTSQQIFTRNIIGTGSSLDKIESGVITASQSGTTVTLSAPFAAIETGRVIKFSGGETAFVLTGAGTTWTVRESQSVASTSFTVFNTNRIKLDAGVRNANLDGGWGAITSSTAEGWLQSTGTWTHSAESSNRNYNELGWTLRSQTSTTANVSNRVVLPSSVTVLEGQQLRVRLRLRIYVGPITPVSSSIVVVGWDTGAVTEQLIRLSAAIYFTTASSGVWSGTGGTLNPVNNGSMGFHTNSSLPALSNSQLPNRTQEGSGTLQAYTTDTFYREVVRSYGTGTTNTSGIRGLTVSSGDFACLFENSVTKANTHTLRYTFRRSWDRAYV